MQDKNSIHVLYIYIYIHNIITEENAILKKYHLHISWFNKDEHCNKTETEIAHSILSLHQTYRNEKL